MTHDIEVYKRRYEREKGAREQAELILETKSAELYQLNETLINLTAQLEQKVLSRTEELQKARDQAIASNEAKSLFLANMSHEIRTPMNGILGVIYLLESSSLSEHQRHLLTTAKQSSELLLAIINDILDVSKIEAGELRLEKIRFNIIETIQSVIDTFLISAQQKELALSCEIDARTPTHIEGDPTRVRQILYNLISNAIKFTQRGSVKVYAKLGDDNLIEVSVRDTGIGIAPDKISHIFSPFVQADDSITRKFGGTGLGLAICAHLTKEMGKEIEVSSTPGVGSTFTFWLSAQHDLNEPLLGPAKTYINAPKFVENLIMLVDDNPVNCEIGSEILRAQGLMVDCFENGQLAFEAITQKNYCAVLMDVQMPVMDGLSATRAIRALGGRYAQLPIVAMTAHARKEDIEKSLSAGMNAHLTKPIEPQKIFAVLEQWLPTKPDGLTTNHQQTSGDQLKPNGDQPITDTQDLLNENNFQHIDVKEALGRTNNNRELLTKVLIMFVNTHKADSDKLKALFDQQEFVQLQAMAHKLKGSSASIGAKKVSSAASQLEKLCKEKNYDQCGSYINQTSSALEQAIQELAQLSSPSKNTTRKLLSKTDLENKIKEFINISQSDLIAAEKLLNDILATNPEHALCKQITQHFDNFEIESIYPLLDGFLPTDHIKSPVNC